MYFYFLVFVHFVPAFYSVYHILMYKRDPRAATGWIMICLFVPYGGPIGYYLFGINRVRMKARGLGKKFLAVDREGSSEIKGLEKISETGIAQVGYRITGQKLLMGNTVTPLFNGDNAYPAMLKAINEAEHSIFLATYILKTDNLGLLFISALKEAKLRGVAVKVLIDGVGELYSIKKPSKILKKHGIDTARFLPPKLCPPSIYINLRNHRKLLIVDNQIAFAGGMNIDANHTSTDGKSQNISDVHFCFVGPSVVELSNMFNKDWGFSKGEEATISVNQNIDELKGGEGCRIVPDGPDSNMDRLSLTIETVISTAKKSVDIMTPYFLPGRDLISSIQSAALRGVVVRIVLPKKNNIFYMRWANTNILEELIQWGVQVYYQPAPFCHSKLMCIDSDYSLVGSANMDSRSLRLNYEVGIEVFSEKLNSTLLNHFNEVVKLSEPLPFERLKNRPVMVRLRDSAAALLSPYI